MSIYLENAASTPLLPEVLEFYTQQMAKFYGNPHADNDYSRDCRKAITKAEQQVKAAINAPKDTNILWTSGGTECINTVLFGIDWQEGDEVISTSLEHPATMNPLKKLSEQGVKVHSLSVDKTGRFSLEELRELLNRNTKLVSIMSLQNEIGVINDLLGVRKVLDDEKSSAYFHTDNVQGFGKLKLDWQKCKFDFMSTSGHKFHAPNSCGALIYNSKIKLKPLMLGGGQQDGQRPGTQDPAAISGYGFTAELNSKLKESKALEVRELNQECREGLVQLTDGRGKPLQVIFHSDEECSPYILSFSIKGYQGAIIMRFLSSMGIHVGVGSACSADSKLPNKSLTAMGVPKDTAFGALRISFGWLNTLDEIETLLKKLQEVIKSY
ncbi:MAG: cysteine desulfurase [Lentisphaeraceae bacterium]|nr:cysteine desulfurase [Lentisphaeraceae bacterium]